MENKGQIHELMPKIMAEVGAIGKDRKNDRQGYNFRGIDDVYNALHDVLAKNGVYFMPKVLSHSEREVEVNQKPWISRTGLVEFTFYAPDGSSVQATTLGEGMDNGDKAANKLQSAAAKYALIQAFCIPTQEMIDSETDSPERGAKQPPARKPAPPIQKPPGTPDEREARQICLNEAFDAVNATNNERADLIKSVCKKHKVQRAIDLPDEKWKELLKYIGGIRTPKNESRAA